MLTKRKLDWKEEISEQRQVFLKAGEKTVD